MTIITDIDDLITTLIDARAANGNIPVMIDGYSITNVEIVPAEEGMPAYLDLTGR